MWSCRTTNRLPRGSFTMAEPWFFDLFRQRSDRDRSADPIPTPIAIAVIVAAIIVSAGIVWWRSGQPVGLSRAAEQARQQTLWAQLADDVQALRRRGRHAEALQAARASVELAEEAFGPSHPATAEALGALALTLVADSQFDGVEAMYARAIEITSRVLVPVAISRDADPDVRSRPEPRSTTPLAAILS